MNYGEETCFNIACRKISVNDWFLRCFFYEVNCVYNCELCYLNENVLFVFLVFAK